MISPHGIRAGAKENREENQAMNHFSGFNKRPHAAE
jgi:hypothetical protein